MRRTGATYCLLLMLVAASLACNAATSGLQPVASATTEPAALDISPTPAQTEAVEAATELAQAVEQPATELPTTLPQPSATPAPLPTEVQAPATPVELPEGVLRLEGPNIDYMGVRFTLPPELGDAVYVNTEFAQPGDLGFRLGLGDDGNSAYLFIEPTDSFAGTPIEHLPLEIGAALAAGTISMMPEAGARIFVEAHLTALAFLSGQGFRSVNVASNDNAIANNESLRYEFMGMSDDRQHFIRFSFDISAPMLLSHFDPAENTNENAFDKAESIDLSETNEVVLGLYNAEAERLLAALPEEEFSPPLGLLDAWIASLQLDD